MFLSINVADEMDHKDILNIFKDERVWRGWRKELVIRIFEMFLMITEADMGDGSKVS